MLALETKQMPYKRFGFLKKVDEPYDRYEELRETLEGIELPAKFTAEMIVRKYKEYEARNPDVKELNERISELHYNIALNGYLLKEELESTRTSGKFHEYLLGYLESLYDFYEFVKEGLKEDRTGITITFLTTDLPHEYFTLLNLSIHAEEISTEAVLKVIEETKEKIARITSVSISDFKQRFRFSVSRAGKRRIKRILEDTFKKIEYIFEYAGNMEKARYVVEWFINIWNCKNEEELPFPDEITFKNLPEEYFKIYMDRFRRELKTCREFLITNYYNVFERMRMIDDILVYKSWNSMVDTLIYSET